MHESERHKDEPLQEENNNLESQEELEATNLVLMDTPKKMVESKKIVFYDKKHDEKMSEDSFDR